MVLYNLCCVCVGLTCWLGKEQTEVLEFSWSLAPCCHFWTCSLSQQTENSDCERGWNTSVIWGWGVAGERRRYTGQSVGGRVCVHSNTGNVVVVNEV
jgi:hypothetical protein